MWKTSSLKAINLSPHSSLCGSISRVFDKTCSNWGRKRQTYDWPSTITAISSSMFSLWMGHRKITSSKIINSTTTAIKDSKTTWNVSLSRVNKKRSRETSRGPSILPIFLQIPWFQSPKSLTISRSNPYWKLAIRLSTISSLIWSKK